MDTTTPAPSRRAFSYPGYRYFWLATMLTSFAVQIVAVRPRIRHCHHFRMRAARLLRETAADHFALSGRDEATNPGVGAGEPDGLPGQRQSVGPRCQSHGLFPGDRSGYLVEQL